MTEDDTVHSFGPLPFQRDQTVVFSLPERLRGRDEIRFVLSLESSVAKPTDRQLGQVLWESRSLDKI